MCHRSIPALLCVWLFLPTALFAQTERDEHALIDATNGISISQDSMFLLNLRFRMQSRLGFTSVAGDDLNAASVDGRIRRLRLRFDGFVLDARFRYYLQLSFARSDIDLESGAPQTVRDAMVYYHPSKHLYFGFGQSKLPGNRERVISSGNLQFPDRSIANALYTLDRDFGLFAYWTVPLGAQEVQVKGAFTTGDGRGTGPGDAGMAYTGRVEWLPFGRFINNGDYSEGDLEMEPKPRLSIGAGYSANDNAYRTGGQLGTELYAPRDINTFLADLMFKYRGWAVLGEYFDRRSSDPITVNDAGSVRFVSTGTGINAQLSRYFRSRFEVATRYTRTTPYDEVAALRPLTEEALIGCTRYLNGHRIKLQGYAGYRWIDTVAALDHPGNAWTLLFQVEFGI
ncbi:MAG: porin [Flavobacteriales bacterium]